MGAEPRRIIVVGGSGFFGRAAVALLREAGARPLVAARRPGADLRLDAEDAASVGAAIGAGDVVIDAAGPFQARGGALVAAAVERGFDVIDISDSLRHLERVEAQRAAIESRGIRVLTSCSSVTTLAWALVSAAGVTRPRRIDVGLAPASRHTANSGTSAALAHSVGRPIRIFREGRPTQAIGWREPRRFTLPAPVGRCRGYLMESVQAVTFPRLWPTLRTTEFRVDTRLPGVNLALACASRLAPARAALTRRRRRGPLVARLFGPVSGGMLVRVEDEGGRTVEASVHAARHSYLAAVAPAVVAALDMAAGRFAGRGLVPHDRQVVPERLFALLRDRGLEVRVESCRASP